MSAWRERERERDRDRDTHTHANGEAGEPKSDMFERKDKRAKNCKKKTGDNSQ